MFIIKSLLNGLLCVDWEIACFIDPFVVIKLSDNWVTYMLCRVCGICFIISLVVFNSAINTLCRLMRRFYRRWLRGDLTGTNWLNLFATDYKIRFGRFQTNIFLQFSNGVLFLATYFRLLLHTICYWTTGSVLPVAILELSSKRLWCVRLLLSYSMLIKFSLAIFFFFDKVIWSLLWSIGWQFSEFVVNVFPFEMGPTL